MSSIEVTNVSKVFRTEKLEDVPALENVSLKVREREFVAIVGSSGCGKSTLLRLVAGLAEATSGQVRVGGTPVVRPREDTGIVFQQPTLLPWRTIIENVTLPLQLLGRLDAAGERRARDLLRLTGLAGFEQRLPRELSGGMQQRAGICRALVHNPSVLLMDEPFGALDALTREEMSLELLRIWTEEPKTVIFVTHSIPEAVLLADRVVVMSPRPGRIVDVMDITLPRPRSFHSEDSPEFRNRVHQIRNLIGKRVAPQPLIVADNLITRSIDGGARVSSHA